MVASLSSRLGLFKALAFSFPPSASYLARLARCLLSRCSLARRRDEPRPPNLTSRLRQRRKPERRADKLATVREPQRASYTGILNTPRPVKMMSSTASELNVA